MSKMSCRDFQQYTRVDRVLRLRSGLVQRELHFLLRHRVMLSAFLDYTGPTGQYKLSEVSGNSLAMI